MVPGLEVGSTIGRFSVLGPLGRGGSASVFSVEEQGTSRRFALKLLRGPFKASRLARFKQEYTLQARFDHENLLTALTFGHHGEEPWFVTREVPGSHWSHLMGSCASQELILSAAQVCRALSYIHNRGIVHRDLKPSNVLLTPDGLCVLIDFGLALQVGGAGAQARTRRLHGTLSYASPEQALGRPVDYRADLYSLGVCLYELLTGKRPFVAAEAKTVLSMHVYSRALPPTSVEPRLPRAMGQLVEALMEKRPGDRPQGAAEVEAALLAMV